MSYRIGTSNLNIFLFIISDCLLLNQDWKTFRNLICCTCVDGTDAVIGVISLRFLLLVWWRFFVCAATGLVLDRSISSMWLRFGVRTVSSVISHRSGLRLRFGLWTVLDLVSLKSNIRLLLQLLLLSTVLHWECWENVSGGGGVKMKSLILNTVMNFPSYLQPTAPKGQIFGYCFLYDRGL